MTKKIVLLPLDERPCNRNFPCDLFGGGEINIVVPPMDILGLKKSRADIDKIIEFLVKECSDADGLVLSMEMLLYGGLLPSRLHSEAKADVLKRLDIVKTLKSRNPNLQIYAFSLIMRCPKDSFNDEEPDYYGTCGAEIHILGQLTHKHGLKLITDEEFFAERERLIAFISAENLADYTERRKFNIDINIKIIDLVGGAIDFLIIPQDDSAKYGYTALDQEKVREKIRSSNKQFDVLMYPGADEIALTLCSRMLNNFKNVAPKVFISYASEGAPFVIPSYEDRPLGETLKYHIIASGCRAVKSAEESDIVLAVSAPSGAMTEAAFQQKNYLNYNVERNLTEFVLNIESMLNANKAVTVCDNAYANGADLELVSMLTTKNLLGRLAGFAGWNTSSNTAGTAMSAGVVYYHFGKTRTHINFLALRLIEDAGYCSVVRKKVTREQVVNSGLSVFLVDGIRGKISQAVEKELNDFKSCLGEFGRDIKIQDVYLPWNRMFEVGLKVSKGQ